MSRACNLSVAAPSKRLTTLSSVSSYHWVVAYASPYIYAPCTYAVSYPERTGRRRVFLEFFFSLSPSLSFLRVGGPSTRARRGTPPFFSPYQRRIRLDGNEASIKGQRFLELREVQGRAVTIYDSRERVKNCRNGNEKERRKKLKWRNLGLEDFWNDESLLLQSSKFI